MFWFIYTSHNDVFSLLNWICLFLLVCFVLFLTCWRKNSDFNLNTFLAMTLNNYLRECVRDKWKRMAGLHPGSDSKKTKSHSWAVPPQLNQKKVPFIGTSSKQRPKVDWASVHGVTAVYSEGKECVWVTGSTGMTLFNRNTLITVTPVEILKFTIPKSSFCPRHCEPSLGPKLLRSIVVLSKEWAHGSVWTDQ